MTSEMFDAAQELHDGRNVPALWAIIAVLLAAAGAAAPGLIQYGRLSSTVEAQGVRITAVEDTGSQGLSDFRADMRERLGRIEATQTMMLELIKDGRK